MMTQPARKYGAHEIHTCSRTGKGETFARRSESPAEQNPSCSEGRPAARSIRAHPQRRQYWKPSQPYRIAGFLNESNEETQAEDDK